MAKRTDTTIPSFPEPPTGGLRAMCVRFSALTGALTQLTAAERDLCGYDGQDPAFAAYTGEVDTARAQVLTHCAVIIAAKTEEGVVYTMQMVAKLVRTLLTTDSPASFAMIRNVVAMRGRTVFFPLYRSGHTRYNTLLDAAFDAIAAYIALLGTGDAAHAPGAMPRVSGAASVAHTEMSRCFTSLIGAMDRFVSADLAIQRPVAGDVRSEQFAAAMGRAETELAAIHDALHGVKIADLQRPEDRTLWEMGHALCNLIAYEDDAARLDLFDRLIDHQIHFVAKGSHAVARRTRQMQARFFNLITAMMHLEDFGGPGPDDGGALGPELAA